MKVHELKIHPLYFIPVEKKFKNFELRINDRDYQVGDILILKEWDGTNFTGRSQTRRITYILSRADGISSGYCILGIEPGETVSMEDGTKIVVFSSPVSAPEELTKRETGEAKEEPEQGAVSSLNKMKEAIDELKVDHKPKQEAPEPDRKNRSKIDTGKIKALKNAGWSVEKIADEMKLGVSTVYAQIRKLKEAGLVK